VFTWTTHRLIQHDHMSIKKLPRSLDASRVVASKDVPTNFSLLTSSTNGSNDGLARPRLCMEMAGNLR
jgi:hypothetical protein